MDGPRRVELPDGIELHVLERGIGPALVLLHGGMGDLGSWHAQMDALARRFRVIAYSRRFSSPNRNRAVPGPHSVDRDVADLQGVLQALAIDAAHLVGTSHGAVVALAAALAQPALALSLVLNEPPLHHWACRTPSGGELYHAFITDVWRPSAQAFARGDDRNALRLLADGIWGRAVFETWSQPRRDAAQRNALAMKALVQAPDPFAGLDLARSARLTMPILLMCGEHASALHRRVVDEASRGIRHAAQVVIRDAGHAAPNENPLAFNDAVLSFLSQA